MADNTSSNNGVPLPPKIDLRKDVLKAQPKGQVPSQAVQPQQSPPVVSSPPQPAPAAHASPGPVAAPASPPGVVVKPSISVQAPAAPQAAPTIQIKKPIPAPGAEGGSAVPRPAASLQEDGSSTTMRLEIPAVSQKTSSEAPTIVVSKPAASPAAPSGTAAQAAAQAGAAGLKSKTTRIPLEMAAPATGAAPGKPTQDLKTIKIKPASGAPLGKLSAPVVQPPGEKVIEEKRKTSRISLEAALEAAGSKGPALAGGPVISETPKTIKLKRPGESPSLQVEPAGAEAAKALGRTTKLEEPAVEEEGPSPTRRKTIKLKRPTDRPAAPAVAVARGEESVAQAEEEAPSRSSLVFDAIALAAAIMLIISSLIVVYIFCAQAFGPNVSLTQLSYGAPGLDLGWPGKLPSVLR